MAKRVQRKVAPQRAVPSETPGSARPSSRAKAGGRSRGPRVAAQVVTDFTVQLATLVGAGIPIVRALTILRGQARAGPFKRVLTELVDDVAAGSPLSEAMGKHERVFDRLYAAMVHAGEAGGVLDPVLRRLATFREKAGEVRSKIVGAMVYPAIVLLVATVVVSIVVVWVIPRFREIFDSFGVGVPRTTQILLDVSDAVVTYWYLFFGLPVVLLFLHAVLLERSTGYRYRVHALLLALPVFGDVLQQGFVAGFARTFGTLIEAGVAHLDALAIVRDSSPSDVFARAVEDVRRTVREGETIAVPLADSGVFDDLVVNMVDVGEETGELDAMLLRVADAYEGQVDRKIDTLFKMLEPALLVAMAIVVGFIVVALFMPLMSIMNELQSAA